MGSKMITTCDCVECDKEFDSKEGAQVTYETQTYDICPSHKEELEGFLDMDKKNGG